MYNLHSSEPPFLAGVELGGTKCIAVLTQGSKVLARHTVATTTPDLTLGALRAQIDEWHSNDGFTAIGIASFGPLSVDPCASDYGCIALTTKPGWSGAPVFSALTHGLGVPAGITTDVIGAALAEGEWGASRGCRTHVYLTIGTGVGAGIVVDSAPLPGITHPEAGHVRVRRLANDDFPGTCVFHGDCLEGLVSGPAITARTGCDSHKLRDDDPVWKSVAREIAELIAALTLTFAPQRIVIGGGVPQRRPALIADIRAQTVLLLGSYQANHSVDAIVAMIVPPMLGNDAGPLGSACVAAVALQIATDRSTRMI